MTDLLPRERDRLGECERIIERGLDTFRQVGAALLEIRDSRLYCQTHATFDDYCRQRWSLSARHANRTIEAAEVADVMGPIGPTNEAQARELAPLRDDPEALCEVWSDAVERTGGKPTAAALRQARDERKARGERGPHEAANHDQARAALAGLADWGLTPTGAELNELVAELDQHFALRDAARRLVREGVIDVPPAWWQPTAAPPVSRGSPTSAARGRLRVEKNRLAEWEIRVMYEAGTFLNWCDEAGISGIGKPGSVRFADQLRYPLEDGVTLPEDFTERDEHNAALGELYLWLLTPDELARLDKEEACTVRAEHPARRASPRPIGSIPKSWRGCAASPTHPGAASCGAGNPRKERTMTDRPKFEGTADSGAARTSPHGGGQVSESELKTMTAEQIVKAQDEGRLDQLLGRDH